MKKEDLKLGNVVEFNDGDFCLLANAKHHDLCFMHLSIGGGVKTSLSSYDDDLVYKGILCSLPSATLAKGYSIKKIYKNFTLKEVLWERKEMPELSEAEKAVLKALPDKFKYIVRDRIGDLELYGSAPEKTPYNDWWHIVGDDDEYACFDAYNHLFQFIKWEDEEPYKISDLLEANK